jgi:Ribonuclease HepT-like
MVSRPVHLAEMTLASASPAPALPLHPAQRQRDTAAEPLTGKLSRLHPTLSRRVLEKLQAAKDALSHALPGATTEDVQATAPEVPWRLMSDMRNIVAHGYFGVDLSIAWQTERGDTPEANGP